VRTKKNKQLQKTIAPPFRRYKIAQLAEMTAPLYHLCRDKALKTHCLNQLQFQNPELLKLIKSKNQLQPNRQLQLQLQPQPQLQWTPQD
jgi:hypothetical protein